MVSDKPNWVEIREESEFSSNFTGNTLHEWFRMLVKSDREILNIIAYLK